MRLYYIDESEGPRYYVRSALGVDAESWNELFADIYAWRMDLRDRYGIPIARELHASDLLAGRGLLAQNGDTNERVSPRQGAEVFLGGLRRLEDAAKSIGGVEVINVCLHKPESRRYEQTSLDRLLTRINTSVASAGRHSFLIFDEGREEMVSSLYRRLKVRNHVPSRYELWEDGEKTRNMPIERVIGGPAGGGQKMKASTHSPALRPPPAARPHEPDELVDRLQVLPGETGGGVAEGGVRLPQQLRFDHIPAQEPVGARLAAEGQLHQVRMGGLRFTRLPVPDGVRGDPQQLAELLLGQARLLPGLLDAGSDGLPPVAPVVCHERSSLLVAALGIGHPTPW